MGFSVEKERPDQSQVVALLEAGEARSAALYPAESNHHLPLQSLLSPNVHFFVGRDGDGQVVATGAIVDKGGWGEIKRMYVAEGARGNGYGKHMLRKLIETAITLNLNSLRLETGVLSHEALSLYRRFSFVEIPPFGEYHFDPNSIFFHLELNSIHGNQGVEG